MNLQEIFCMQTLCTLRLIFCWCKYLSIFLEKNEWIRQWITKWTFKTKILCMLLSNDNDTDMQSLHISHVLIMVIFRIINMNFTHILYVFDSTQQKVPVVRTYKFLILAFQECQVSLLIYKYWMKAIVKTISPKWSWDCIIVEGNHEIVL